MQADHSEISNTSIAISVFWSCAFLSSSRKHKWFVCPHQCNQIFVLLLLHVSLLYVQWNTKGSRWFWFKEYLNFFSLKVLVLQSAGACLVKHWFSAKYRKDFSKTSEAYSNPGQEETPQSWSSQRWPISQLRPPRIWKVAVVSVQNLSHTFDPQSCHTIHRTPSLCHKPRPVAAYVTKLLKRARFPWNIRHLNVSFGPLGALRVFRVINKSTSLWWGARAGLGIPWLKAWS